jgi:hypothetical protein
MKATLALVFAIPALANVLARGGGEYDHDHDHEDVRTALSFLSGGPRPS